MMTIMQKELRDALYRDFQVVHGPCNVFFL